MLRLVLAPLDDHVDLDRGEAGVACRLDAVEDAGDGEVDPVHPPEGRVVERIERDRDSVEPGIGERSGEGSKCRCIRGQREVDEARPSGVRSSASIAMRSGKPLRTSGSPPVILSFCTPRPTAIRGQPRDLLVGEHLRVRQERVVAPEYFGRHAVGAPEIAPIRDRDPEIAERAASCVEEAGAAVERRGGGAGGRGRARLHARMRTTVPGKRSGGRIAVVVEVRSGTSG